jgi:hypothetical protein
VVGFNLGVNFNIKDRIEYSTAIYSGTIVGKITCQLLKDYL